MKHCDKMHYEEEFDLFCSCIGANINIIRQFMRLIIHFYSKLTLNHHRVFVITFFCDHMCLYTLWAATVHYKSSLKNLNPWLCHFSHDWIFNTAQLCGKTATLVHCTLITYEYAQSLFKTSHASQTSKCSSYHFVWGTSNSTKRFTKLTIKFHIWNHQWNRTTTVSYMLFLLLKLRYKKQIFQARSASAHAQSWARVSDRWLFL